VLTQIAATIVEAEDMMKVEAFGMALLLVQFAPSSHNRAK
jgi:hypothetical protein